MRVCADLGCIQESKMLPRLILDGNTTVRWQETYAMVPLALELPEEGTKKVGMSCPVCGEELQIKLASVARLHLLFTLAFFLGGIPDAMQIADDPARAKGAELGYSGMKGHKLFKIHREV